MYQMMFLMNHSRHLLKKISQINVCLQCGDIGITEALAYCIKCKSATIHRYCLEEVPEDFTAETNWLCEDCKSMSPNYASKSKFPTTVDVGILDLGSGRAQIGPKNICQEIGSANGRLFNSHDQHPVSNVRIGSSMNMDNHVSYGLKRNTLSCTVGGAVGTIRKYDGFKLKDGVEECDIEKSKKKRLILSDKDKLDNSQSPVNGQDTNIEFTAKRLPDTSVEASDIQIIGGTSNCGIGGLEAGRLSVCFGLKEDETEESEKEKSKKIWLFLPYKNELNNFHPLISGEGTNFSLAVKRIPGTSIEPSDSQITGRTARCSTHKFQAVESSPWYKQKDDELEEHVKRRIKSNLLILQTNNVNHLIDGHGTSISFLVKRLPDTSVERSDWNTIGMTLSNDTNTLDAVRSSVCCMPKEDDIEEYEKKNPKGSYIVPCKDMVDQFHPVIDGQGKNISFSVERLDCTSIESGSRSLSLSTENEMKSLHSVIDKRGTVKFSAKSLRGTSVEPSDRQKIKLMETKAEIKFPCQLTSPSLFGDSHVWRGCFNINKAEFGPLTANLSRTACLKVCNFARKLPLVLHMQKFPRLVAWPNSFKVSSPTVDNVALYFFPESDRVEAVLDDLVDDIINNDLMLRFQFDEVDLLVLSSFVLPQEHQMFFGRYYPWGVFKPRSSMINSLPTGSHTGYQVGEALKPVRRSEEEDHNVRLSKYSSHETNDFTLRQYSIQPKEENLRVTANSTNACEEGKLQTLGRKPSGHVELLWHREEQLGDCKKKLGIEMSMNYTSELKEVAEEKKRELMG